MDQSNEKPFKTIEVIDSKTNQVCKVACMSCIRGHRTTSCGIPVCRNKVFWTVKRPGRPSNSCTCRYGATGGCKCVVVRQACPHKAKKGEKRSGECRCDEQGRYCCLIEPDHWHALFDMQKPTVVFCKSREELETKHAMSAPTQHMLPSPGHMLATSPGMMSVPSTPGSTMRASPAQIVPPPYDEFSSRSSSLTPRFGLMGIGASHSSQHDMTLDMSAWNGTGPPAPRNYHSSYSNNNNNNNSNSNSNNNQAVLGPGCTTSGSELPAIAPSYPMPGYTFAQQQPLHSSEMSQTIEDLGDLNGNHVPIVPTTVATSQQPIFDMQKMQADFDLHRLPSAICQSCGYGGCKCKACPPLFQNPFTGSWAQCCKRKHEREPQSTPQPEKVPRSSDYDGSQGIRAHAQMQPVRDTGGCCGSSTAMQQVSNSSGNPAVRPADSGGGGCCGSSQEPQLFQDDSRDHGFQPDDAYTHVFDQNPDMLPTTDFNQYMLQNDFAIPHAHMDLDISEYLNMPLESVPSHNNTGQEPAGGTPGHENGALVPRPKDGELSGETPGNGQGAQPPKNTSEEPPGVSKRAGCCCGST